MVENGDFNTLEQQLEAISQITKHFNVVLLLDEADAFMEERTSYNDIHNRLVAIFLRKLRYYPIKYEDLTTEFRREIWKSQLSRPCTIQGPAIVGPNELQKLDNFSLNGRAVSSRRRQSYCSEQVRDGRMPRLGPT